MVIDSVTVWWDRYGVLDKMNKINEIIAAINSNTSGPTQSVVAIMNPHSGASWMEWYRTVIVLDALNEKVSWSAGIPAGYSRYRYVVWYTHSVTGVSLRHWSGKWRNDDTLSFNVQNSFDIFYGSATATKAYSYAHPWQSLDGSAYDVGGYINLNNSGVWTRLHITVEYDKGTA